MSLLDAIALRIGYFVLALGAAGLVFICVILAIIVPSWIENAYNAVLFFRQVDATAQGLSQTGPDGKWRKRTWRRWLHGLYKRTFIYTLRHESRDGYYKFTTHPEHPTAGSKQVSYRVRRILPDWWYSRLY